MSSPAAAEFAPHTAEFTLYTAEFAPHTAEFTPHPHAHVACPPQLLPRLSGRVSRHVPVGPAPIQRLKRLLLCWRELDLPPSGAAPVRGRLPPPAGRGGSVEYGQGNLLSGRWIHRQGGSMGREVDSPSGGQGYTGYDNNHRGLGGGPGRPPDLAQPVD
eukprot:283379-Prorocentrum_minimum.AAC.5